MMKQDTAVVVTKATCFVIMGFFGPLTVGLAQWANSGEWPSKLIWIIMGATCINGAASQLLSFLSGAYSDYVKGRANGGAQPGDTTQFLLSKLPPATPPKTT